MYRFVSTRVHHEDQTLRRVSNPKFTDQKCCVFKIILQTRRRKSRPEVLTWKVTNWCFRCCRNFIIKVSNPGLDGIEASPNRIDIYLWAYILQLHIFQVKLMLRSWQNLRDRWPMGEFVCSIFVRGHCRLTGKSSWPLWKHRKEAS